MKEKLLFVLLFFSLFVNLRSENLIPNNGFENGMWPTDKIGSWSLSSDAKAGNSSLKATSITQRSECASSVITINPNGVYRLSAWIKTNNITNKDGVEIRILQIYENNQAICWLSGHSNEVQFVTGRHKGWQKYERTITNFHPACKYIKIYLRLNENEGGEAFFDEVSLSPVSLITNFSFESELWKGDKAGQGWVRNSSEPYSGTGCIYSEDRSKFLATKKIDVDSSQKYSLSAYIKTEEVIEQHGVQIQILQSNSQDQAISWYRPTGATGDFVFSQSGTLDYTKHQLNNITFHPDTTTVKVYVRHLRGSGGKAWIDDVQLVSQHKDNFLWGIGGHSPYISSAYKKTNLAQCLDLLTTNNIDTYRVDFQWLVTHTGAIDWSWPDLVVSEAYLENKRIYGTISCNPNDSYQAIYDKTFTAVTRYKGKIDYYQLCNEVDCKVILGAQYSGLYPSHYNQTEYAKWKIALTAMSEAVHAADPDAQRVINISWMHTGFLEMLDDDGVEWDVCGLDWYWGATAYLTTTMDALLALGKEIIVAESNKKNGTNNATEQEAANVMIEHANYFYNHNSLLIKGFIVYELLDEILHPNSDEKYYGLYNSAGTGNIGTAKIGANSYSNFINARK